jgi:ADP-ribose pyrophosphatase
MSAEADFEHLKWTTLGRRRLNDFAIFSINQVERMSALGTEGKFIEVDAPDWVTVIPRFEDPERGPCFLMVRQYRHGSSSVTLEFPAGIVEPGEMPEISAARELLEETGFRAESLIQLGSVSPNPAFMNNTVTTFLADGIERVQEQLLDEHEVIDVVAVPVDEVTANMGSGEYNNGIMMISLAFYLRRLAADAGR